MQKVLNYQVNFIKDDTLRLTKEQAEVVAKAWGVGIGTFTMDGEVYACHQIRSITRNKFIESEACKGGAKDELSQLPQAETSKMSPTEKDEWIEKRSQEIFEGARNVLVIKSMSQPRYEELLKARADSGEARAKSIISGKYDLPANNDNGEKDGFSEGD